MGRSLRDRSLRYLPTLKTAPHPAISNHTLAGSGTAAVNTDGAPVNADDGAVHADGAAVHAVDGALTAA